MKPMVLAVLAAVVVLLAAGFAWQQHQAHLETKAALASARAELEKTTTDLRTTRDQLIVLRKEFSEQQLALNQLQAEMVSARAFVEAEKAVSARLREDLGKVKEEYAAALRAGRAMQVRPATPSLLAPPQPMVIQAGPRGSAVSAPMQAR
jgi:septal ring factor EnvC (AmiA/AmiB activator)